MKDFKIRASGAGKIIGKGKGQPLTDTAKSYVETWLKGQLYNRRKEFTSKYTDKGLINEDHALDIVAEHLGFGVLIKNELNKENDYFTGTADIILNDLIIDVKCPWDCFTFPLFMDEPPKDYYYQAQVYMELFQREKFQLIYVLTDTPFHLIEREAYFLAKNMGYEVDDILPELQLKMTYKDVDPKLKLKVFDIEKDPDAITELTQKVIECREYVNELLTLIK